MVIDVQIPNAMMYPSKGFVLATLPNGVPGMVSGTFETVEPQARLALKATRRVVISANRVANVVIPTTTGDARAMWQSGAITAD